MGTEGNKCREYPEGRNQENQSRSQKQAKMVGAHVKNKEKENYSEQKRRQKNPEKLRER